MIRKMILCYSYVEFFILQKYTWRLVKHGSMSRRGRVEFLQRRNTPEAVSLRVYLRDHDIWRSNWR